MISVILLMAGKGSRMNKDINKILLDLNNKPIYKYSLDLFLRYDFEVIAVVAKDEYDELKLLLPSNVKVAIGGSTRQQSVFNGLKLCSGNYVIIHDAARPLLSKRVINDILKLQNENRAILVGELEKNTIKQKKDNSFVTLPRNNLVRAMTPQCAPLSILKMAHELALIDKFEGTDDLSLIEKYCKDSPVDFIISNEENFKITTPLDFELAKLIVKDFIRKEKENL